MSLCLSLQSSSDEGSHWSYLPCSCSPSFCFSFGPRELSKVFQCGSLSLSPSFARWRFYGDMQNILQYCYGPRPVQAHSPLLSRQKKLGNLSLDLGTPPVSSLLQTLKWLPYFRYIFPCSHIHPSSLPPFHSPKLSPILPFSFLSSTKSSQEFLPCGKFKFLPPPSRSRKVSIQTD